MAAIKSVSALVLVLVLVLGSAIFAYSDNEVKNWCSQTPYPAPCEHFLTTKKTATEKNRPIASKSHFLRVLVELAIERAVLAQKNAVALGPKCQNDREKSAWTDCIELYDQIIHRLNRTAGRCSPVDVQTWLSAALTALDTCRAGFEELGVSAFGYSLTANNVSKLISDGLSVNKPASAEGFEPPSMNEGFPTWVKPGERKLLQSSAPNANVVVAKDGSGRFRTVSEAVAAAKGGGRFVIYVKAGVYSENVEIKAKNVMLIGDGIGKTIITGSRSVGGGSTTFRSATVAVDGDGFIARDITIRNTAGASNHQAVALRSGSDLSVYYRCSFEGFQDTLYVFSERQFYKQCDIYGTVDFIFGNAAVVIQDSNIIARDPPNKTITITAQGRADPNQNTGISIHNCRITSASGLSGVKAFLGRPWREYSRTVVMTSSIGGFISPAGWMEWSGNFALNTLYYGEYKNTGAGASTANRVKWKGYRVITSVAEASKFTVGNFIAGGSWLPSTGVPFTSGL